jgi:hypothetical protein
VAAEARSACNRLVPSKEQYYSCVVSPATASQVDLEPTRCLTSIVGPSELGMVMAADTQGHSYSAEVHEPASASWVPCRESMKLARQ